MPRTREWLRENAAAESTYPTIEHFLTAPVVAADECTEAILSELERRYAARLMTGVDLERRIRHPLRLSTGCNATNRRRWCRMSSS